MTALVVLCASLVAAAGAGSAASLVPARVDAALLLQSSQAADGLRSFFDGVAQRAPALSARAHLAALVGADLFAEAPGWGLSPSGGRAIVLASGSFALSAPVREAKAARSALEAWLREAGPVRTVRSAAGRPALSSGDGRRTRIGMIAPVGASLRLLTASGEQAQSLIAALGRVGARTNATATLAGDAAMRPALSRLTGPAALVLRSADPVRGAALALDGSAQGLIGKGLVLATAPLLAGHAPGVSACAGATLLCVRAALGPSGRDLLSAGARAYLRTLFGDAPEREAFDRGAQRASGAAEQLVVRSDGADVRFLSGPRSPLWALRVVASTAPGPGEAAVEAEAPRPSCIRSSQTGASFATPCTHNAPDPTAAPTLSLISRNRWPSGETS